MAPTIIATAPGRCGIIGNPTDMYGGCVISCTTVERAECILTLGGTGIVVSNDSEAAILRTRCDLELHGDKIDIARAALAYFEIDPANVPMSIKLRTDVPMRAGLAGSTALLATLVGAIRMYLGRSHSQYHLAETCRKVEARVMNIVCGLQDQHMTIFGGLNYMDFRGKEMLDQSDDEPLATVEPLSPHIPPPPILLAHTGVQHHSSQVHGSPRQRWLRGETLVRESYAAIAELARRGKRALIEGDWSRLGSLMDENHRLVAELGGSGPENDRLIAAAKSAGAYGAKLAGAGGGGTIIALTEEPERVGAALLAAGAECLLRPLPQPGLTVTRENGI